MRRTQNYGLPIIESEDRYSKEEQNNAMDIIDGELHGLSQSFKNVINDVNTSIESVVNNVNTSIESAINDVNTSIESVKEFENKIQEDYDSLKRIIIDENASAKLQNQINTINDDLQNHINTVNTDFQNQINAVNTNLENTNMEVRLARGTHNTLNDRLCEVDEKQNSISSQLEEINQQKGVANGIATLDSGGNVPISQLGNIPSQLGNIPKSSYNETSPPGCDNDETQGYSLGSMWAGANDDCSFIYACMDSTMGEAVWKQVVSHYPIEVLYMYNLGDEMIDITGGWVAGYCENNNTITKETQNLKILTKGTYADTGIGTYVTKNTINLDNVKTLRVDWESIGDKANHDKDKCFFAVIKNQQDRGDMASTQIIKANGFSRQVTDYNVTNLTGDYHIAVGNVTYTSNDSNTLLVYSIEGVR